MKFFEFFKKKKECEHYWTNHDESDRKCIFCKKKQVRKIDKWEDVN